MPGSLNNKLSRATDSDTGRPVIATLSGGKIIGASSITISDATNWTTNSKIYFTIFNTTTTGYKDSPTQTDWVGTLSGTTISNLTLTGGTDRAYLAGATVEQTITGKQLKDLYDVFTAQHNGDTGAHAALTATSITNSGNYSQAGGTFSVPNGAIAGAAITDASVTPAKMLGVDLFALSGSYTASPPTAGSGQFYMQAGSSVVSFAGNVASVTFATPFPNGILTIVPSDGDRNGNYVSVQGGTVSVNGFSVYSNVAGPGNIRINWIAVGW